METYKSGGEQFTFVRKGSSEFKETVQDFVLDEDYGRVSVWFRSEEPEEVMKTFTYNNTRGGVKGCSLGGNDNSYNAGGIALSGSSNQTFGTAKSITRYGDVSVIYDVRLVEKTVTSLYSPSVPKHSYSV